MSDLAAALHAAAEHVAAHPDLPTPYITGGSWGRVDINYQLAISAADDQRAAAVRITRAIGGRWEKQFLGDTTFRMCQDIGDLRIGITADREQVCERRVVGMQKVTVPAVKAKPAQTLEREVIVWDCAPILADNEVS